MLSSLVRVSSRRFGSPEGTARSPRASQAGPESPSSPVATEPLLQVHAGSTPRATHRTSFLEMTPRKSMWNPLPEHHHYQSVLQEDTRMSQQESEDEEELEEDIVVVEARETCSYNTTTIAIVVILMNTVVIAAEAAWIRRVELSGLFRTLELLFTCCYVIEVLYRVFRDGITRFFTGGDWPWNLFDVVITGMGVLDAFTVFLNHHTGSGADVARLFRMLRVLRLFRVGRKVKDMDYVIMTSLMATMKLAVIVVVVLFVFAIIATHLLWDCEDAEAAEMFQTLGKSMWTLFEVMTGVSWVIMVQPAMDASPNAWWFFGIFVFTVSIALLSLVPAIFIQLKLDHDTWQHQHEERARELVRQEKDRLMREGMFTYLDRQQTGDGTVSASEAQKLLANHASSSMKKDLGSSFGSREFSAFVRDVQLGLFVLRAERSGDDVHLDRQQFEETMALRARGEDQEKLWRNGVESRREVQLLGYELRQEVARLSMTLQQAMMPEMAQLRKDLRKTEQCYDAAFQALVVRCEQIMVPGTSPEPEIAKPSEIPYDSTFRRSEAIAPLDLNTDTPTAAPAIAKEVDNDLQKSLREAFKVAYRHAGESASSESNSGTSRSSQLSKAVEAYDKPVPRLDPPLRAGGSEGSPKRLPRINAEAEIF